MYNFVKYSKEEIESRICSSLKAHCEEYTEFGWLSKKCALEIILNFVCVEEAWNEVLDCPSTNFTVSENIGFRYHIYSPSKQDIIYNPMKIDEAMKICEKVLVGMTKKNLVVISKSGKGVKYVG